MEAQAAAPSTTAKTEIRVTLLGQPCTLEGPFDAEMLKAIHGIGPAQIYPTLSANNIPDSLEQSKKALDKIRANNSFHSLLDRYREKLRKRLEAQVNFLTALQKAKSTNETNPLLKMVSLYLGPKELKSFAALLKKSPHFPPDTIEALLEQFNDAIEPDPETEFHRAIKKLGIQYLCVFDGG
ncbi:unnamed protein product [Sphagnum tenellum]